MHILLILALVRPPPSESPATRSLYRFGPDMTRNLNNIMVILISMNYTTTMYVQDGLLGVTSGAQLSEMYYYQRAPAFALTDMIYYKII